MSQFDVHKNNNPKSKSAFPYLVVVQTDLIAGLATRVVVPVSKVTALRKKAIRDLTPIVEIDGAKYLMLVPQLAGIAQEQLGPVVGNLRTYRDEIVSAMDFLITGV
jgi:toxin CcdB